MRRPSPITLSKWEAWMKYHSIFSIVSIRSSGTYLLLCQQLLVRNWFMQQNKLWIDPNKEKRAKALVGQLHEPHYFQVLLFFFVFCTTIKNFFAKINKKFCKKSSSSRTSLFWRVFKRRWRHQLPSVFLLLLAWPCWQVISDGLHKEFLASS